MRLGTRLKIGVDARSLLCREPRGEGKSLLRLYQEMTRLRPGLQAVFYGNEKAAQFTGELPPGCRMVRIDWPGSRINAWENLYFPAAARWAGCNVLHCSSSGGPAWAPLPSVMTVHDLIPLLFDDGQSAAERENFDRRLRHGLRNARRVIAVSHHTAADLRRVFPARAGKVEVIHWGGDEAATPAAQADTASPYVLAFGGSARRKNTDCIVERFAAVAARVPALRLVMVGVSSPAQQQHLAQMTARLGIADRVELPGFVSEAELTALLRGATLLVYLSLYEGFGLPLLEAITQGVPVVASDLTSIPEILAGVPGCFSLQDTAGIDAAIVRLAQDPAERQRWIAAQGSVLKNFRWEATAQRTLALLENAAG